MCGILRSARQGGHFCGGRAIRPGSITDLRDFDTIDYELCGLAAVRISNAA